MSGRICPAIGPSSFTPFLLYRIDSLYLYQIGETHMLVIDAGCDSDGEVSAQGGVLSLTGAICRDCCGPADPARLAFQQDINECSVQPCLNGGKCADLLGGHRCACRAGFTGADCAVNIDECRAAVCPDNSDCVDGVNGHDCVCRPGFSGETPLPLSEETLQ